MAFGIGAKIKGTIDDFDVQQPEWLALPTVPVSRLQTAMAEAVDAGTFERAMLQTMPPTKGVEGSKSLLALLKKWQQLLTVMATKRCSLLWKRC